MSSHSFINRSTGSNDFSPKPDLALLELLALTACFGTCEAKSRWSSSSDRAAPSLKAAPLHQATKGSDCLLGYVDLFNSMTGR